VPTEDVTVETLDGSRMPAVLTWPEHGPGPWPVAVVLGELFGLTDVQRDAADRVAGLGHVAIAPHLLHRRAPGPLPEDDDGRTRGLALIEELTRLELLSDVRDALDAARTRPQADAATGPVAVGLSFGGHVAVLAASRLRLRACVALYPGWLAGTAIAPSRPQPTGSLPLTGPLLVLAGDADPMTPPSDLEALRRWHPEADIVTYPGVGHRFASVGRPGYDADAAADAWSRIATFLERAATAPPGSRRGERDPAATTTAPTHRAAITRST
jgi:carboxymethylenebutenolidase